MSTSSKPGGSADSANLLVTILGMVFVLGALWIGDVLTRRDEGASRGRPSPAPRAMVEVDGSRR